MKKAVLAIIIYNGNVVLGKKRSDSKKELAGLWHIPAETLKDGESDEEGLKRCAREELGLEIKVGRFLAKSTTPSGKDANWYECSSYTQEINPSDDLEEARWVRKRYTPVVCKESAKTWPKEIIDYFNR